MEHVETFEYAIKKDVRNNTIVREVDASRPSETVSTAADIVFWCVFGALVTVLLVQITSLVSFNNRRSNARWWMLGVLLLLAVTVLAARQFAAVGDRGVPLDRLLLIQLGLSGLGLLFSVIPAALRSGTTTPCPPKAATERTTAPRLRGSVTPSRATISGGRPSSCAAPSRSSGCAYA